MQNAAVVIQGEELIHRVGDLIRKARKSQGLTQAELGHLAGGKDKETIVRMERGQNTTLLTLAAIAEALGTTADIVLSAARSGQASLQPKDMKKDETLTPPVNVSMGRGGAPIHSSRETIAGGLEHGRVEGPPPDYPIAPIPSDDEIVAEFREHADLLLYIARRITQHTAFIWNLIAAYDAGQIRSDRTPRPPNVRSPIHRGHRSAPTARSPKKAS